MSTHKRLTCGRTWSIYHALLDVVPLHISFNLLCFDFFTSNAELESSLVSLDKGSLLAMSDYSLHLLWFDVLVELPLTQTRSVLANPEQLVSPSIVNSGTLILLGSEPEFLFDQGLDFRKR
jgi:hypothetical protein